MPIKRNLILILFFIFFIQQSGVAQVTIVPDLSDSIIQKLIRTAKAYYPRVKTYQNRINAANDVISKNKAAVWEALTVSYLYQPNNNVETVTSGKGNNSYFQGFQAGIFFNLGTLLERPFIVKQSKEDLAIAHNDQDEYMITLATEVKKRYYTYVMRLGELKLQTKGIQDSESSLKDIRYKFEKGEETFDNYNKAQADFTNREVVKIEAESNLFAARADLEELLGTKLENIK